jgi:hypothetical protein
MALDVGVRELLGPYPAVDRDARLLGLRLRVQGRDRDDPGQARRCGLGDVEQEEHLVDRTEEVDEVQRGRARRADRGPARADQ